VGDSRQLALRMQHAEAAGDRLAARSLAQEILALPPDGDGAASQDADRSADPSVAAARVAAEEQLARAQPDPFLLVVGLLGLGATVWLVYNYVL
jgi:hypothetical protein